MPFLAKLAVPLLGLAGSVGKGRAANRAEENAGAPNRDIARLHFAEFNRQAPGVRARNAIQGDTLASVQPYQLTGEGRNLSATGGLSPALFSTGTRELGNAMRREAILSGLKSAGGTGANYGPTSPMRQMMPDITEALKAPDTSPYAAMTPTPDKRGNWLDTVLQGAGYAANLLPKQDDEDQYSSKKIFGGGD